MGMGSFAGGIGAALNGWQDGTRQANADNKQVSVDAYDEQVRQANAAQIPLAAEAKRLQLVNQNTDAVNAAELKPIQQQTAKTLTQGQADMAPGQVGMAKKEAASKDGQWMFNESKRVYDNQLNAETMEESVRARVGQRLLDGDFDGVNTLMQHAFDSPVVFKTLQGQGKPVKTELAEAPAGAMDIGGKPITGQALRLTMEDGAVKFIPPTFFAAALKRQQAALEAGNMDKLNAGQIAYNKRTGKEVLSNDNGYGVDENGNTIKISNGRGVGAGKGVNQTKLIDDAWEWANKGDTKLAPEQLMPGRRLTEELMVNNNLPPALAAEVAYAVTKDPKLVQPSIDQRTGDIVGVYKHPTRGEIKIDSNIASAKNPGQFKPEDMKAMANKFVSDLPAADRAGLQGAAFDPAKLKVMFDEIYGSIDKAAADRRKANPAITAAQSQDWSMKTKLATQQSLQKKLELINLYGNRPPKDDKKATKKAVLPPESKGFGIGTGETGPASMDQQAAAENAAMGAGTRLQYSPAVKSYIDQQQADEEARAPSPEEASRQWRAREAQRAKDKMRGYTP